MTAKAAIVVRRTIAAPIDRVFDAWIDPDKLIAWWGPRGVACTGAEIDARVGGAYRIDNRLPDGETITIRGRFEQVDAPHRLVFSWRTDSSADDERVTVDFVAAGDATEVIVTHEQIADETVRRQHEVGWQGCLEGLAALT